MNMKKKFLNYDRSPTYNWFHADDTESCMYVAKKLRTGGNSLRNL